MFESRGVRPIIYGITYYEAFADNKNFSRNVFFHLKSKAIKL